LDFNRHISHQLFSQSSSTIDGYFHYAEALPLEVAVYFYFNGKALRFYICSTENLFRSLFNQSRIYLKTHAL